MRRFRRYLCLLAILVIAVTALVPHGGGKQTEAVKLEPYNGKVYHIFTHSLILDTSLAFSSPTKNGYNDWMITRGEFKKCLDELYKNNFILIDIDALVTKNADGSVTKNTLYLPAGKKPLVLSVDDVNYYDYMKGDGFADRLTVDDKGRVVNVVKDSKGGEHLDYEGDVVPIVDSFIDAHPDFSLNGAKGVLALTGYQGVFGYRTTTLKGGERDKAVTEAKKVAEALKSDGWKIASHSYTHTQKFRDGSITTERLKEEIDRWNAEIAPITGKTHIFISPFGMHLKANDERLKCLVNEGFYIYCPVSAKMDLYYGKDFMIQSRLNLDGFTFQKYPERVRDNLFDPDKIIDKNRPNSR